MRENKDSIKPQIAEKKEEYNKLIDGLKENKKTVKAAFEASYDVYNEYLVDIGYIEWLKEELEFKKKKEVERKAKEAK